MSQVGKVLSVSKERVRQIQDRALNKLRIMAAQENLVNGGLESLNDGLPGRTRRSPAKPIVIKLARKDVR